MAEIRFRGDFLLGTATSSVQIEGGDRNNTWYKWCEEGHIHDSSSCYTACDHWNRLEGDAALLKRLNVKTHRMSLEWSRLEPLPGQFSAEVLEHYRREIELLVNNQILPLVTLHHFSEPLWFQELGGWRKSENSEHFIRYVGYVVENLGDLVSDWVTFNEPNVYTFFGYTFGIFPPGLNNIRQSFAVLSQIIKTHIRIYTLIHTIRREREFPGETQVGIANHIRIFDGLTIPGKLTAWVADYLFNQLTMEGVTRGRFMFPLPEAWKNKSRNKKGRYVDFLGINYYTRNIVEFAWDPSNYFHATSCDEHLIKTDLGWDIYPEGIYRVCKKYYKKYRLPIYITENGLSDKDDSRREDFIRDHLAYVAKAIGEGIPIKRYYHWTLMDNFEWLEGEEGYFGLYHCDFRTKERTERNSAVQYAQICERKEL